MAIKGVNPFEQHVEKIVVGVAAAAFLGVLTMQFIGHPNSVKIGNDKSSKPVPLDQAFDVVAAKAKEVEGKITSVDPPAILPPEAKGVLEAFRAKQQGPISPHPQLAAGLDKPRSIMGGLLTPTGSGEIQNKRFAPVKVGAPTAPLAAQYIATIHPLEVQQAPELAKLLPPAPQPPDKASISVEATFNGKALADAFAADPDGDGPAIALPPHWWLGMVQILSVGLERQELKPDGTWSDAAPVDHMPGRIDLKAELEKGGPTGAALKAVLDEAAKSPERARRPDFYSIIFGEEWVPPRESVDQFAAGGAGDEKARLHRQRDAKNRDLAAKQAVRDRIANLDEPKNPPKKPTTNPGGGNTGGGKGGSPGTPTNPGSGSERKNEDKTQQLKMLDAQIEKLFEERAKIDARLAELGEKMADAPGAKPDIKPAGAPAEAPLLDNDSVRLWAHDVTVERGKTYRYRMHLFINNPIAGHGAALLPEQADLAKPLVVRSADSEWTEPVKVDDQTYFFITSAQEQDPVTKGPKAAAEVYVFSWGFWRKGAVNLEPGDALTADVKLPDMEKALAAAAKQKGDMDLPGNPAPAPDPGGKGGGGGRPAPGQAPEVAVDPNTPKPVEPVTFKQVKVENDALLLDVANTAALGEEGLRSQKTEQQAYLRAQDGRIIVRVPEAERQSSIYQRVSRSALRGDEATQPKTANPETPRQLTRPEPKDDKNKKPTGPGGGGG